MTFDAFMRMTREMDVASKAKVFAYDADSGKDEEVTGIVIAENGDIYIQTDSTE